MAKLTGVPRLDLEVNLTLNESEINALDALAGYGTENFLKVFYEHMGRAYLKPHEEGLRSLFETIRTKLPFVIGQMDRARKEFRS